MPRKSSSSNTKGDHRRRDVYSKSNGTGNGKQKAGPGRFRGTVATNEERGERRAFSMRDEALYTMRHHSVLGGEANSSPSTRSAVTFVKSAGLPGNNNDAKNGQTLSQWDYPQSEESAEELYNELLDEEDELVENTRHLSILPIDRASDNTAASAFEIDPQSASLDQQAEDVSEVDDMTNVPDDMLFMADEVKQDVDVPFNDEIVFAPRHIRLSASGVRLPPRSLDLTTAAPFIPIIVDETVYAEIAETTTIARRTSEIPTTSRKKKKNKNKKTKTKKAPNAAFPYNALVDDDDEDPLNDYIQNLYDDGILDEFLGKDNPADDSDEDEEKINIAGEYSKGVVQKSDRLKVNDNVNLSEDNECEGIQIETEDNDQETKRDDDEGDDEDDDEEEEDVDMDQDDYDYDDDDDILEAERQFAEAAVMDFLPRKKKKQMPEFDISDEDLGHQLESQWLKDKAAKKEKKKERERLRREGLLGKKAKKGKLDLNAKYSRGMQISDIKREIEIFLRNEGQTTLSLPPMAKNSRRAVHVLATAYNLSSKSIGGGTQRFTILFKNSRSHLEADFGTLSIVEDRLYLPRLDKKATKGPVTKDFSKRGTGTFRHRDGDVVGSNAPEIDIENKGRQLLEKMGWISGSGLGVAGNVGMASPIMAKVKTSKAGLG
ncbi:uncharacterized protein V1513DRAFT_460482 [Lipomyces chichibuensis]|uniref:uncharacterized protein n=1 Tax=Lipomyces chichibuensis TaxID=1546026 RepID=UPI003343909D